MHVALGRKAIWSGKRLRKPSGHGPQGVRFLLLPLTVGSPIGRAAVCNTAALRRVQVRFLSHGLLVGLRYGAQPPSPPLSRATETAKITHRPPTKKTPHHARAGQARRAISRRRAGSLVLGRGRADARRGGDEWRRAVRDHSGRIPTNPTFERVANWRVLGSSSPKLPRSFTLYRHRPNSSHALAENIVEVGDPAADLAIVTRGVRRPFQVDRGRDKLLDAYNDCSSVEVDIASLTFFELALLLGWLVDGPEDPGPREIWLNQIGNLLGR
jgi:hypothetical protein